MLTILAVLAAGLAVVLAAYLGLPLLLHALGLHPAYRGTRYVLPGRRALIITTSHARLDPTNKATGVYASEMTMPYYAFADAGMQVDIASVRGGAVPIEPDSLRWPVATDADRRYQRDSALRGKTAMSIALADVDISAYDIIFLAGGWGAAYDLGTSPVLGALISRAWADGKVVGGVCHGPLGLLQALDTDGTPLVRGRRLTAVTDRQLAQLRVTATPKHPERELRAAGALYASARALLDPFANLIVADGRLVTGQNQNAGEATAHAMMQAAGGRAA